MKVKIKRTRQLQHGAFTLVEMLVVVAIIAILAGILIPVVGRAKTKAKVAAARVEMAGLETAIKSYKNDYNRWPLPKNSGKNPEGGDFTYGVVTSTYVAPRNEALMDILMAEDRPRPNVSSFPLGYNPEHSRNPKKNKYFEPKVSTEGDGFPGLSLYEPNDPKMNGRYHDPFGNEYFISIDLNGDGFCADHAYHQPALSGGGLVGLVSFRLAPTDPTDIYGYKGGVMIWSAGPDMELGAGERATEGKNQDNILSWQ